MTRGILLLILFSVLCFPLTVSGQWKMFEHRSEYKPADVLQASELSKRQVTGKVTVIINMSVMCFCQKSGQRN